MDIFNSHNTGLSERDLTTIRKILVSYPEVTKIVIFGSRAKGTFHTGSDIDLAIMDPNISGNLIRMIQHDFEESSLPYRVDVLHYSTLKNDALKAQIMSTGKLLYTRQM